VVAVVWQRRIELGLERLREQKGLRCLDTEPVASFSHNDYLGLSVEGVLHERALQIARDLPTGSRGSRLLGGNHAIFETVEKQIAQFFDAPAALFFSSGYMANLAAVTALGTLADSCFCDEKLHASLIDGVRLLGKPKTIVPHQLWSTLPGVPAPGAALTIAETLYSMDGDTLAVDELQQWQKRSGSFLLLDEAHACGVMDETGRGLSSSWRQWDHTVVVVTFGKAFGVAGAAVLSSPLVRELLINHGRSFIYTTAPSPWTAALVLASLQVMSEQGQQRRELLWQHAREVRQLLESEGVLKQEISSTDLPRPWDRVSPIIPVPVPGNDNALRFAELMREFGWGVKAIRYPTVPKGSERIRISLNLQVGLTETLQFTEKVVKLWKAFSS
jgi:8-amino-7-oxononanoate synthase